MQFITDKARKYIYKIINISPMIITSSYKLFSNKNGKMYFEILLIDYYNSLMIKKRMNTLDNDDIEFLNLIDNNEVEDLRYLMSNINFIRNSFIATINFESLATLDKQHITKIAYEEKEDNDLTKRLLYNINLLANNPSYQVDSILEYYKEYIQINGSSLVNHDRGRDIIFEYLKDMKDNDLKNYELNLMAAIPVFYKWGKYLQLEQKENLDSVSKSFLKRIEWLKISDIIEVTKYDTEFLSDVITQYLYFETLPQDMVEEIGNFSQKKLSKRMKRKINEMNEYKN